MSDHTQLEGGRGFGRLVLHFCHMHGKGSSFLLTNNCGCCKGRGPLGGPVSIKTALFLLLLDRNPKAGMTPPLSSWESEEVGSPDTLGKAPHEEKARKVVRTKRWSFSKGVYSVGMDEGWMRLPA